MAIKSDEISNLIKQRIKDFDVPVLSADVGIVTEIGDGIAQIYGLRNARSLELLEFKGGVRGMALNLEEDAVGAVILGPYEEIREGDEVRTTGGVVQVPVGSASRSTAKAPSSRRRRRPSKRWLLVSSPGSRSTPRCRRDSKP